jgi:hypothetical protein
MKNEKKKFTVECEMNERWIPHFLGMLKYMQQLGSLGSSRNVTFYVDGDGDFHPKFSWPADLPEPAKSISERNGDRTYDAG